MSEYYKSLISDDEVIKELIKESKQRREGTLQTEVPRLKPNLNFFQRTVNNLVSNNNRIDKCQDTFKQVVKVDETRAPVYKCPPSKKPLIDYGFERHYYRCDPKMSEYYKSLISDDQVIKELIKESKHRRETRREDKTKAPVYKCPPSKKPLIDYPFERHLVLQTKLKFVRARGNTKKKTYNCVKQYDNINKIIDELSTESDDSDVIYIDNTMSKPNRNYRKRSKTGGDDDVICISSSEEDKVENKMKQLSRKTRHKTKLKYK